MSLSPSGGLPATPDWQRSFSNSFPSQIVTNLSSYFEVATLPSGDSSRSPTGLFGAQTSVCLAHRHLCVWHTGCVKTQAPPGASDLDDAETIDVSAQRAQRLGRTNSLEPAEGKT